MALSLLHKIEIDLTVRVFGTKDRGEPWEPMKEPVFEVLEERKFNKLDLKEALRKLTELL